MMLTFVLLAQLFGLSQAIISGCSTFGQPSCLITAPPDTCCTEYPGGLLLQTQFWNTHVRGSPADSWTIHGLWDDNCDGSYTKTSSCDPSRNYNISQLLTEQGATSTLEYMQKYWLNGFGTNEKLWDHEWAAHGSCFSTLKPSCLPSDSPRGAEAVAYCETTIKLFQALPTYIWLAEGGITPSTSKTYSLSEILAALRKGSGGYMPDIVCRKDVINEVSWYFHLQGSVIDGNFVPVDGLGRSGKSCPENGIKYPPKSN